jgi:hypothetical protein
MWLVHMPQPHHAAPSVAICGVQLLGFILRRVGYAGGVADVACRGVLPLVLLFSYSCNLINRNVQFIAEL